MADDVESKKSDSSLEKTLSKSSLYAPLTAYASGSLKIPKKVAKSHSEAQLIEWLHHLSADYHQSRQPGDPRNTGNRFLSTFELQDKIMHRSLSLFGKEYSAKLGSASHAAALVESRNKANQKKRKRSSKNTVVLEEPFETTNKFLENLNRLWTQYMLKLLEGRGVTAANILAENDSDMADASQAIYECANAIEWVGASVRIEACHVFASWKGREGFLVSITKNTWVIVERQSDLKSFRRLLLPKKGSVVTVSFRPSVATLSKKSYSGNVTPTALHIRLNIERIPAR